MAAFERLRARPGAGNLRIEILPPIADPRLRRIVLPASLGLGAALLAAVLQLAAQWHLAAARYSGAASPGLLLAVSATLAVGFPTALWGLTSLLFAEETIEAASGSLRQEILAPGGRRERSATGVRPEEIVWTSRPVGPWWTWTFRRLTLARRSTRRLGLGATLGGREKEKLAEILRRAIA